MPPPGHLPNPGIKPRSPALQADSLPTEPSEQLTGTDEAAGRCCLIGLQVLIKRLTGADQLADRC